jgi:L-aspartate oxidase
VIRSDFLVIGSGIAGISYALKVAAKGTVAIVTKKRSSDSSTNYAQGGIASVMAPEDSYEKHIHDTLATGCGLSDPEVVRRIVEAGPDCIRELISFGVEFSGDGDAEELHLGREGGHSERRVVHAADYTGREIERRLLQQVRENENITIFENHVAVDLIVVDNHGVHQCIGATCLNSKHNTVEDFFAGSVMLATGGAGVVYLHTTNPPIATGSGVAMAYRAGASIANMEFIQFHPTTLYQPDEGTIERSFLISEAVRGEGGHLYTQAGDRFMHKYHRSGELAARDVVARAIDSELKASGDKYVYLDVTHLDPVFVRKRFPNIFHTCKRLGIYITKDRIPVVPAAHYMCGGVKTGIDGSTDLPGLSACGEVTMTGMHGANRLASNSLLEAVATARFAAEAAECIKVNELVRTFLKDRHEESARPLKRREQVLVAHDRSELLNLMWDYVGVVRSDVRLRRARDRVAILDRDIEEYFQTRPLSYQVIELRDLSTVASLIIAFAIERKESRGLHYNADHPVVNDREWRRELVRKEDSWIEYPAT